MIRAAWRLVELALLALGAFGLATLAGILLYEPPAPGPYAAIVVLSEGVAADGTLSAQTAARTRTGVDLYEAGLAPLVVFSGGKGGPEPKSKGALMADVAVASGLPRDVVRVEGASHSTLHNALYTARLAPDLQDQPILIVTHRYHAMRALASFWWAGFGDVTFAAADPARIVWDGAEWEPVKWAGNTARAAVFSLGTLLGAGGPQLDELLR
jgi:uncharacterized SAM-binding protein YcdF (DUF218 family)